MAPGGNVKDEPGVAAPAPYWASWGRFNYGICDDRFCLRQHQQAGGLKVFASPDAANTWFEENDPEGAWRLSMRF